MAAAWARPGRRFAAPPADARISAEPAFARRAADAGVRLPAGHPDRHGRYLPRHRLIVCHHDLHPENVLADTSGAPAVLDWDNFGPADPARELALAVPPHPGAPHQLTVR